MLVTTIVIYSLFVFGKSNTLPITQPKEMEMAAQPAQPAQPAAETPAQPAQPAAEAPAQPAQPAAEAPAQPAPTDKQIEL